MQQVDDELQFMQHFVVGDFRLVAGFDQRLVTLEDQVRGAAAQHRLLAEQIRLGLFREGGLQHATAGAADAMGIGQRLVEGLLAGVLRHGDQRRHAATLLVLATHQATRALGRDQHHVEVLARLDLLEVDVEAVREQQRGALRDRILDLGVQRLLRGVRHQDGDQRRTCHRFDGSHHRQAIASSPG